MFFFKSPHNFFPFNEGYNLSNVKKIEYINLRYMPGRESPLEEEEFDHYEIIVTFLNDSVNIYEICENEDVEYFFEQMQKLGLKISCLN